MLVLPPPSFTLLAQVVTASLTVALTGVLVAIAKSIRRKKRAEKLLAPIDGPKGTFLLGFVPELTKNLHRIHDFQMELITKYGGRAKVPWNIIGDNMVYISDPKDVEHMLSTNMNNYIKSDHLILSVGDLLGKALLGTNHAHTADDGAMFRLQRKLVSRVFTTSNFKAFTEGIFHKYALRLADIINAQNGKCEMHTVASQYTLQSIFDIGVGMPLESFDKELGVKFIKSMDYTFGIIAERILLKPYFRYFWWCMPSEYQYKREAKVMTDLIDGILYERLAAPEEEIAQRSDVLSLAIMKARELHAEGEDMLDIPTLRAFITSVIFAGRDTTSSLILYCFYTLAQYPEQQEKILEELKLVDTSSLTYEDVKKLKYLDAFVMESQRLYPTSPANLRQAAEDDHLPDGTFIPAGTELLYSSFYLGRNNAKLWGEDQLTFRPERWLEMKRRPTAYEFPVFHGGPRICPGMNLALLETKIFIATLVEKFHVKIQDGEQLKDRPYVAAPTLVMVGGLPLQLTPRTAA
ncbi:Cytochrome p450 86a2 [Globisporangium polare]